MQRILRFGTARPLPFVLLATGVWILVSGVAALIFGWALHRPVADVLSQSLGTLAATACLMVVMGRWGWLHAAGVAELGSWRLWLVTVALAVCGVVAYQIAFFDKIALSIPDLWATEQARAILGRQVVVGVVEETLFRGFLLFALVRVWGNSRRGLLAAITIPALMFGLPHVGQVLAGNPVDDTLMTVLNCFVAGVWFGALVLLGGRLWPAVLIHAASNACYQITALSLGGFDPTAADYAVATASELPMVLAGLWLLLRRAPGSIPIGGRRRDAEAFRAVSGIARLLLLVSLVGAVFLTGCAGETASTSTPTQFED
jgi:membrane protease YdiL (CAAX protease family)